jgi:hypothetical protein
VLTVLGCAGLMGACSPEARRVRDGGPGADPGNKPLVGVRYIDPQAADTTLWPGRAPTPLERLAAGTLYAPRPPVSSDTASRAKAPSKAEQGAFEKSAADPRRPDAVDR